MKGKKIKQKKGEMDQEDAERDDEERERARWNIKSKTRSGRVRRNKRTMKEM